MALDAPAIAVMTLAALLLAVGLKAALWSGPGTESHAEFYGSKYTLGWLAMYTLLASAVVLSVGSVSDLVIAALLALPLLSRCISAAMHLLAGSLTRVEPGADAYPATVGGTLTCILVSRNEPSDVMNMTLDSVLRSPRPGPIQVISIDNSDSRHLAELDAWRQHLHGISLAHPDVETVFEHVEHDELKPGNLDRAIRRATGDYILLADVDSTFSSDIEWIESAIQKLRSESDLAFVQLRVLPTNTHFNALTDGIGRYQYLHNLTDYVGALDGFALFKGHNAVWARAALLDRGSWVSRLQGRVILAEDLLKTCEVYANGARGCVIWAKSGEWLPASYASFASMWRRWLYGTWQTLIIVLRGGHFFRLSRLQQFELLRRQQFAGSGLPYILTILGILRPSVVMIPYLLAILGHLIVGLLVRHRSLSLRIV